MPTTTPGFFLRNPVGRSFVIIDRFNVPRAYTFAPHRLQRHEGIDLAAIDAQGRPVTILAAQRGMVDTVGFDARGYGTFVRVVHNWHDGKWVTWYAHMSEATVSAGQFVMPGQKLGVAGTTGYSSGIHLHLTLQHIGHGLKNYVVDDVLDPEPYFNLGTIPLFDDASFVDDITIPDGTVMQPGESFRKTWRIRNTGTTTWDRRYRLAFAGDNKLGGPDLAELVDAQVQPGQVTDASVVLVAPTRPGSYRSTWRLKNPEGALFSNNVYTEIEVGPEPDEVNQASYVADVTIEDGTVIQPGATFIKTWRMRNTGTTTWDRRYSLRCVADDPMGGPAEGITLPRQVGPGQVIDLSVTLTAPTAPGRHRSTWQMHDGDGEPFPHIHYAEIRVPQVTPPDDEDDGVNEARYVADVTIPDGTGMRPGAEFVKTWRIRNSGTTTWGAGYTLAFAGHDQMDGPDSVPLPPAKPGEAVDISVTLYAPDAPGLQRSTWKPRDADGEFFEFDLFALIKVEDDQVPPPTLDELSWIADITVEDGTIMSPGERFLKTWRVRNTGNTAWKSGYSLAFFTDDHMEGPDAVALPPAKPGEVVDVSVRLTAPNKLGLRRSTWKPRDADGNPFDHYLFALIDVFDPDQTFDMVDFLRGDGRLYDVEYNWDQGGVQRMQTQSEGDRFFHVKNVEWEELWADEHFIYRGTDTSPGSGQVYTLMENGNYGSAWIPRFMTVGVWFRRMPTVIFRRKSDGAFMRSDTQVTWIQLESVRHQIELPNRDVIRNVAILAAYEEHNGQRERTPFERYFYAQHFGLVAWGGAKGWSRFTREYAPGSVPNLVREELSWLT